MAQLNDLLVLGKSNLLGDTSIFGAFNINGDVLIDGTLTVNEAALFKSSIEASGSATVGGAATIKGRLYANDGINLPNNKKIIQAQNSSSNYTTLVEWNWADKGSYSYYPQIGHHSNADDGNGALILMYAPSNTSPWTMGNNTLYLSNNRLRWNNLIQMDSSRNFIPTVNNTGSIGTSSYYWNNGYLTNLTIKTALTLNGTTYLNGNLVWKPNVNITCTPTAANQEFSIDVGSSSFTGSYFHIWSAVKSTSILTCYPDDLSVKMGGAVTITGTVTANSTALIKGSTEIQNNVKITNGNLTIHRDSSKANNTPAKIIFSNKQTDTPVTTNVAFIAAYDDQDANNYGQNLVIQGGSNVVIGAGESPSNFYTANLTTSSGENLYLTADSNIYFYPKCDTVANAAGVILDTSRQFYPILSAAGNAGSLGTSNYRWSNAYIVNLNASGTGTISGNTSIGGTLNVGSTLTVGSTTLLKNTLTVNGNIHINQTAGSGTGLALYGTSAPTTYGIYFAQTANYGKHGDVQGDWATYFSMNAVGNRGWVFRPTTKNVASISANGVASFSAVGDGTAYMAFPKGGTLTVGSPGQKGYLTIVMPAGFNSTMIKFKVSVYNYSTGTSVDYIIGGYCYNTDNKWYNPTAYCIGPRNSGLANLTVNYGMSGSNPAIQIGAADTAWEYPNIAISDVYLGHNRNYSSWAKSWTVSITTTAITSITQTISNTYMGNFTGTDNKIAKFASGGKTITNSTITDDGSTVTIGANTSISGTLNMNNNSVKGVGDLAFADPGAQEGITWTGGNNWWIYESPDDLTNAAGNLQFVHGTTRRLTINKDGYVDINCRLVVRGNGSSYNEGIRILPASNNWSNIFFSANTSLSGEHDGGWLIGRRGAAGAIAGAIGDFTIEEQSSGGANLTIHKDSNGATLQGLMRSTVGYQVQRTSGDGYGLGLYDTASHNNYGIHMSYTSSYGTFGHVSSDWATYFCFDGNVNRGWIFKHAGTNVFSINGNGTLSTRSNIPAINFRVDNSAYYTTVSYQTAGNEALVFAAKNAATSFIFVNGEDGITNTASDRWYSLTPGLQIKNNCVAIGKLIANGTDPSYKLEVAGTSYFTGKMQVNAPIFGYNYTNSNNAAAFMWDKPGSNYTGVGANGTSDTIYFSACDVNGAWVSSYKQKWKFNGDISADNISVSSLTVPGGYVKKREDGTSYTQMGTYYAGGSTAAYVRIALPVYGGWDMCQMEFSIRQTYGSGNYGKLTLYAHTSGTSSNWTQFYAVYHDRLTSSIKVYGSDSRYFYIAGISAWGGLTLDKIVFGDGVTGADMSAVVIDGVSALPSTYQTATMLRSWVQGDSVTSAVWNDYAEYRESDCKEFGRVLMEKGDDSLTITNERLSHFAGISSDTWGFSQGETEKAKTPIAVAGRVLAYPYQDRNNYKPGDCVCAAPGGTVDIMTRQEIIQWPDRIVGTVSSVPEYKTWGGGENADRSPVQVNGRIWIKVK